MSGARYMVRGLGYFHSLNDLATVAVGSHDGTPVLLRDLDSSISAGHSVKGAAEWNGEGETVGAGIVVMRQGQNALRVIEGIKE